MLSEEQRQAKREQQRRYREKNRERIAEYSRAYRKDNAEAIRQQERNSEARKATQKRRDAARGMNPERKEYLRQYKQANRTEIAKKEREGLEANSQRKLAKNLRIRLNRALKGGCKNGSAVELLGCSTAEAINHIESMFEPGMSWSNWGEWHIDHILPLASFDLENAEQLAVACRYTNLRPLWKLDNLRKGARNTAGHAGINAFGDTSSGCALGQGTHRSDSQIIAQRRRNPRPLGRGGCQPSQL